MPKASGEGGKVGTDSMRVLEVEEGLVQEE
jgi:hypothetical protein